MFVGTQALEVVEDVKVEEAPLVDDAMLLLVKVSLGVEETSLIVVEVSLNVDEMSLVLGGRSLAEVETSLEVVLLVEVSLSVEEISLETSLDVRVVVGVGVDVMVSVDDLGELVGDNRLVKRLTYTVSTGGASVVDTHPSVAATGITDTSSRLNEAYQSTPEDTTVI